MKYLDYPILTQLSGVLSANPSPEARINVRVEAYSIKQVAKERKMFKEMEEAYVSGQEEMEEMSFSPEMKEAGLSSCFGRLDVKESRKVHFLLVSTLNTAFPEYDFSALRPDHFMREISAAQALSHLSSNLLAIQGVDLSPLSGVQPGSLPNNAAGSSPTVAAQGLSSPHTGSPPTSPDVGNPSLYRILNEVVPLSECEAYSWVPEPEYDPHVDPEENEEATEYEESDNEDNSMDQDDVGMDIDIDGGGAYVSWGQAGMEIELDDPPTAPLSRRRRSLGSVDELDDMSMPSPRSSLKGIDEWTPKKVGGLLWSANYFFYSKRQKRVLFITTWCRKRPSHEREPTDFHESGSMPLPISSSWTPPVSSLQGFSPLASKSSRPPRVNHHNLSNARPNHRRSKLAKLSTGKSLTSATIPIRGLPTPVSPATPSRLAASAPSTITTPIISPPSMSRFGGPGIKPRQTAARMLVNAAATTRPSPILPVTTTNSGIGASRPKASEPDSRVRKERSGSLTPGPGSALGGIVESIVGSSVVTDAAKGKRVKV
ncbi:Repressor of RNA polymerase III transcription maf1 [Vanrija pseudolonga]|uniref:Repressor of RNA polymerase III transcription maf1 n=1 Tax=Vanrija pseudolonga TaxID=143232 RepID=A0AAF1BJ26_9TREE|nr:Repressor of RNA polymerase III transcription maf1 [Vanrija pseudolonga]